MTSSIKSKTPTISCITVYEETNLIEKPLCQSGCKPNSVEGEHLSGMPVTRHLKRPTRESSEAGHFSSPIWSCSGRGLPCVRHHWRTGGLLPHLFTLTPSRLAGSGRYIFCGTFHRLTPSPRYGASCPAEFGLSSSRGVGTRSPAPL